MKMGTEGIVKAWNVVVNGRDSHVAKKHEAVVKMNEVVAEYSELFEGVALERANLILTLAKAQLTNAELAVSKSLFTDLELELADIRATASKAVEAIAENRALKRELVVAREDLREARIDLTEANNTMANLKGQITKLKNKADRATEGA